MEKKILPWSLKGVSRSARDAAKVAAAREGIPLGAWLARTIRDIGAAEGAESAVPEPEPRRNSVERAMARLAEGNDSKPPH